VLIPQAPLVDPLVGVADLVAVQVALVPPLDPEQVHVLEDPADGKDGLELGVPEEQ